MSILTILIFDTSGDWRYIAAVVCEYHLETSVHPHIASKHRILRKEIIHRVLDFINNNCYGVCLSAFVRKIVRNLMERRKNKDWAWRTAIKYSLSRIRNHLVDKGFRNFEQIFADNEFRYFKNELKCTFGDVEIFIGKLEPILLADVLAYVNLKMRYMLKKYRNISEI